MTDFWEKNKIVIAIILGALIIGLFIFLAGQTQKRAETLPPDKPLSPTERVELLIQPTATIVPLPSPTVTIDDNAAIKTALAKKLGTSPDNLEVTVSKNTGIFAKGNVREKEAVGGGYFLAAKVDGAWIIVYDGQSQPPCNTLSTYNFPKDMAPECLNASGQVVER